MQVRSLSSISSSIVADPVWKLENSSCTICDTSLMKNPQSQALVSPSSGCLALLVLKRKTIIRDVQFLELHTCFLICVSSGFGWWSLLLKYWEGVSIHIRCIAKQPGKSLEMILSPANHNEQFKNCRSACFACSEAFAADSAAVKKFNFPKLAQNNVGFFLLPNTTIYQDVLWWRKKWKKFKNEILNWLSVLVRFEK